MLPSLTIDEYMSLKQLKIEVTHTDFVYSAYTNTNPDGWDVVLRYRYGYDGNSSSTSTTFIWIPIFRHNIQFFDYTMTRSAPSTDFGKAYASPHYSDDYKTITGSYAEYNANTLTVTTYNNHYTNVMFFDKLTYPYMTYQCSESILLYATSGSVNTGWMNSRSRLSLPNSVYITVKIYGAY